MTPEEFVWTAHAFGDPTRVRILAVLLHGRDEICCSPLDACCPHAVCACDIQDKLGLGQSRVSYHLKELKDAGLILETHSGRWNYYQVNVERIGQFGEAVLALIGAPSTASPLMRVRPVQSGFHQGLIE